MRMPDQAFKEEGGAAPAAPPFFSDRLSVVYDRGGITSTCPG